MAPIATRPLNDIEHQRLGKHFPNVRENTVKYVRTKPGNFILPLSYEQYKEEIFNWKVRSDDVYVIGYYKTGTTWVQEMTWCIQNDVDLGKARTISLNERSPYLESPVFGRMLDDINGLENNTKAGVKSESAFEKAKQMESPRILKSNMPFCLLPVDLLDNSKVVLILRNPKDTVVSYYHYLKLLKLHCFSGDFEIFFDLFMDNLLAGGSYWEFVQSAWNHKDHPNVCILFYEDMNRDLGTSIRNVASFLQKDLTDIQIQDLAQHLSFPNMKSTIKMGNFRQIAVGASGSFFRKGEVGDWKNYFTDEMNRRMDEAIEKYFKGTGLAFIYE